MVGPDKDGSMKNVIRLAKELNITNHLKITGKVKRKDWIELSKKYDIFINTTNFVQQIIIFECNQYIFYYITSQ